MLQWSFGSGYTTTDPKRFDPSTWQLYDVTVTDERCTYDPGNMAIGVAPRVVCVVGRWPRGGAESS
jgi:hypothetical protein